MSSACQLQQNGATAVSILTKEENDFIKSKLLDGVPFQQIWIGFSRNRRTNWGWTDGSQTSYTNWIRGEDTKDTKKRCAIFWTRTGFWESKSCTEIKVNFICKYNPRGIRSF